MMGEASLLSKDIKVGRLNSVTKHPLLNPLIQVRCLIHLKERLLHLFDHLLGVNRYGIMRDL